MTKDEYQQKADQIRNDEHYTDLMKIWMLSELTRIYNESETESDERPEIPEQKG